MTQGSEVNTIKVEYNRNFKYGYLNKSAKLDSKAM